MPARKKNENEQRKRAQKQFMGYVEKRLNKADKEKVNALAEGLDTVTTLENFTGNGFRPAFKWDWDSNCWRLDLYRCYQGYPDSGYSFCAKHTDFAKTVAIADYVINHCWDGQLPVGDDTTW